MVDTITIAGLPATASPTVDHLVPAMKDGVTVYLSVAQIVGLAQSAILDGAPGTLDTLNELAAALGDDENYATTTAAALALRLRVDADQSLTSAQKLQGRANIEADTLPGHLWGLTLSNNGSDATNDIDIAVGSAADGTGLHRMVLSAVLTKQLDAAWAVGTGNGGLDTGSIANGTYHVWLIQRSDTGVVDALSSTSATAPTMPASYDRKRRIGSIIRASGSILGFTQIDDRFYLHAHVTDVNLTPASMAKTLRTLTVPSGVRMVAMLNAGVQVTSSADGRFKIYEPDSTVPPALSINGGISGLATGQVWSYIECPTNISAQVATINLATTNVTLFMNTVGWIDSLRRGA